MLYLLCPQLGRRVSYTFRPAQAGRIKAVETAGAAGKETERNRVYMKIGFTELVLVVIVAFVFIGPDQLPSYARKLGKMLRELRKYTSTASKDIQENIVEPLNEIQQPIKEAIAPLTDIKKDLDSSVKDVTKSFTGIGKTSRAEAEAKAAEEPVEELEELTTEEAAASAPAETPVAAPEAPAAPQAEPAGTEDQPAPQA